MSEQKFSALVVDDEPALRRLTVGALSRFNFDCDEASDGDEAGSLVCRRKYDVVVTDLRMPKRNGHALAVELLAEEIDRPLIVVLTGVLEPRLAQDLIVRGVDEVEFKPVNFALFGAKIRARCEHRVRQKQKTLEAESLDSQRLKQGATVSARREPVTAAQLAQRLDSLVGALPVSPAAIDVINLVKEESPDPDLIASSICRDPGLSVELLKIANSSYYNPSGQLADDLKSAILRLGHRRIGELALASASLQVLSKSMLPWVDAEMVWRRCLAAGLAIEQLCATACVTGDDEGLFISAMVVPMSRVLLGMAFPELYQQMIQQCLEKVVSLRCVEREMLNVVPEDFVAKYLERAGLSPRLYKPLKQASLPYVEVGTLTEPLRTKVERLRIASMLGNIAVGRYAPWEEVDFPPSAALCRAGIDQVGPVMERLRENLVRLAPKDPAGQATGEHSATGLEGKEMRYFKLSVEPNALLGPWIESLGVKLIPVSRKAACTAEPVLINCFDVSDERLAEFLKEAQPNSGRVLVGNVEGRPASASRGSFVTSPCNFGAFVRHLNRAALNPSVPAVGNTKA